MLIFCSLLVNSSTVFCNIIADISCIANGISDFFQAKKRAFPLLGQRAF
jgi:hypothetical protein